MASIRKVLTAILSGRSDMNVSFADLRRILSALAFVERVKGGHHIFTRQGVEEIVNLQPLPGGQAKPYQVRQVRQLITRYGLSIKKRP